MRSEERRELYGAWAERWPSDAAELLDGYSGAWWIGGSWAIDVATGSHSPAEYVEYAEKAIEYGFAASRGSDFHSHDESHTALGQLPWLPGTLKPVWELLEDRIR